MAALDLQEQEQLEALKAWWKENGNRLLGVLLIAVVAMGGWRGWQYYQNKQGKEAARAKTQLQWVIDHAGEDGLKDVARLRLAAVLLDEKNYADAMKLLEAKHPASFDGLYADLRGDVLSAQGKTDEARNAYKLAYEKTDAKSMYRNLIQMKMDALGEAK